MLIEVSLAKDAILGELHSIGIADAEVEVEVLSETGNAVLVSIVSELFEETSFLDREMRLRPAVARSFALLGIPRVEFIIEAVTQAEKTASADVAHHPDLSNISRIEDDSVGRAQWRQEIDSVIDVLKKSHFTVTKLGSGNVYAVERGTLNKQRMVVGFASSVTATTVDIGVRKTMQTAHESQRLTGSYYLSPHKLDKAFANQKGAHWMTVLTVISFLKGLAEAAKLAQSQIEESARDIEKLELSQRGPVVEADVKREDMTMARRGFFSHAQKWMTLEQSSLLLVMAPAGHGKTTLCREMTRRLADAFRDDDDSVVPLMVPFESVRRTIDFDSLLYKRYDGLCAGSMPAFIALLQRGSAVLLVDGFDELADDAGMEAAENQVRSLRHLMQGRAKVLLAGRSLFAESFAGENESIEDRVRGLVGKIGIETIEVMPFGSANVASYIDTREGLTAKQKTTLKTYCFASTDHELLASNPLFLRILCSLAVADKLPDPGPVAVGVDLLLDRVCEREEERQHLGIGVYNQRQFLRSVVEEMQSSGRGIPRADVPLYAQFAISEAMADKQVDIYSRLAMHALLKSGKDDRIEFVHPLIRDVILGSAVVSDFVQKRSDVLLAHRDLPEGAVQYLALNPIDLESYLPDSWLSQPSLRPSAIRRNLFRVFVARARYRASGNPRDWIYRSEWTQGAIVHSLDMSNLMLSSLSFDEMTFDSCVLTGALFDDCDFRGTTFLRCKIENTVFASCRSDEGLSVGSCVVDGVTVHTEKSNDLVTSSANLQRILSHADWGASFDSPPPVDAVKRIKELARLLLEQLVKVGTNNQAPKFHTIAEDSFVPTYGTDRERAAVQRVLLPGLKRKVCEVTVHASSKTRVSVDKRFQGTVVSFLRTGVDVEPLSTVLASLAAKAAKYIA